MPKQEGHSSSFAAAAESCPGRSCFVAFLANLASATSPRAGLSVACYVLPRQGLSRVLESRGGLKLRDVALNGEA